MVGVRFFDSTSSLPRYAHFYPTAHPGVPSPIPWAPYGDVRYITEFARNLGVPLFFLRHLGGVTIEAAQDAPPLPEDEHKYIVFSHGLHGHQTMYTSLAMEWASNGYHVLCAEHTDGSAAFTIDHTGKPIEFADVIGMTVPAQLEFRFQQLSRRTDEMIRLVHSATPRAKEIVLTGHSFGGCTALNALCELVIQKTEKKVSDENRILVEKYAKIQSVILLDLWPFAITHPTGQQRLETLKNYALESPFRRRNTPVVLLYNSEDWSEWEEYNRWARETFFQHDRLAPEFFTTMFQSYTDHYSISDMGLLTPYLRRKKIPYGRHGEKHIRQCAAEVFELLR